jgi:hypothetical protein
MSLELMKIVESKAKALKKEIPEERKALRLEMSGLYERIADSARRRMVSSWSR